MNEDDVYNFDYNDGGYKLNIKNNNKIINNNEYDDSSNEFDESDSKNEFSFSSGSPRPNIINKPSIATNNSQVSKSFEGRTSLDKAQSILDKYSNKNINSNKSNSNNNKYNSEDLNEDDISINSIDNNDYNQLSKSKSAILNKKTNKEANSIQESKYDRNDINEFKSLIDINKTTINKNKVHFPNDLSDDYSNINQSSNNLSMSEEFEDGAYESNSHIYSVDDDNDIVEETNNNNNSTSNESYIEDDFEDEPERPNVMNFDDLASSDNWEVSESSTTEIHAKDRDIITDNNNLVNNIMTDDYDSDRFEDDNNNVIDTKNNKITNKRSEEFTKINQIESNNKFVTKIDRFDDDINTIVIDKNYNKVTDKRFEESTTKVNPIVESNKTVDNKIVDAIDNTKSVHVYKVVDNKIDNYIETKTAYTIDPTNLSGLANITEVSNSSLNQLNNNYNNDNQQIKVNQSQQVFTPLTIEVNNPQQGLPINQLNYPSPNTNPQTYTYNNTQNVPLETAQSNPQTNNHNIYPQTQQYIQAQPVQPQLNNHQPSLYPSNFLYPPQYQSFPQTTGPIMPPAFPMYTMPYPYYPYMNYPPSYAYNYPPPPPPIVPPVGPGQSYPVQPYPYYTYQQNSVDKPVPIETDMNKTNEKVSQQVVKSSNDELLHEIFKELQSAKEETKWLKNKLVEVLDYVDKSKASNTSSSVNNVIANTQSILEKINKQKQKLATSNTTNHITVRTSNENDYDDDDIDSEYSNDFELSKVSSPNKNFINNNNQYSNSSTNNQIDNEIEKIFNKFNNKISTEIASTIARDSVDFTQPWLRSQELFNKQLQSIKEKLDSKLTSRYNNIPQPINKFMNLYNYSNDNKQENKRENVDKYINLIREINPNMTDDKCIALIDKFLS